MDSSIEQRRADHVLEGFTKHPGTVTRVGVGSGNSALTPASAQSLLEAVNQQATLRGMRVKTWIDNTATQPILFVQHIDGE